LGGGNGERRVNPARPDHDTSDHNAWANPALCLIALRSRLQLSSQEAKPATAVAEEEKAESQRQS
jgi:hypothetical protein